MNGFSENRRGTLRWMTADQLSGFAGVRHGFTTRFGGVSEGVYASLNLGLTRGDVPAKVRENYRIFGEAMELCPEHILFARQIHSDIVWKMGAENRWPVLSEPSPYEGDALITNEPGQPLMIFIADCIPILFYAADSHAVGAAHAGWRGTVADIAGKTARRLCEEYGGTAENLYAAIGAGISFCCFETGPEVYEAVKALGLEEFARAKENGKYHIDLKAVNRALLIRAGIAPEHISVSEECTKCMPDKYWSHRATKGVRGSQAAFIMLQ